MGNSGLLPCGSPRTAFLLLLGTAALAGCAQDVRGEPVERSTEADTVCAKGSVLQGVDVSNYQGTISWSDVQAAGISFAITKATQATDYIDPTFAENWSGMKAAGIVRGAYHYFDPSVDATAQANYVLATVGTLEAGDLPIMLDFEQLSGLSEADAVADAVTFLSTVTQATGKTAMLYMSTDFLGGSYPALAPYVLWVASYGVSCPGVPSEWSTWSFWQDSDAGDVNGISGAVDVDQFNGTLAQLQALVAGSSDGGAAGYYGATYVSQSWPLASTPMTMTTCQTTPASITLKNTGTKTWDSNTRFATTQPRNRVSLFADSTWVSADRAAQVSGTVAPGATFEFKFDFHAPPTAGNYKEYFGLTEDGVAWFSDPGQGGPADDEIEANITVTAGPTDCTADEGVPDGGETDGGEAADGSPSNPGGDADAGSDSGAIASADAGDAGTTKAATKSGGGGCSAGGSPASKGMVAWSLLALALGAARRRSSKA